MGEALEIAWARPNRATKTLNQLLLLTKPLWFFDGD
jgi:hypothetical protein